jgi:hypothetical protein
MAYAIELVRLSCDRQRNYQRDNSGISAENSEITTAQRRIAGAYYNYDFRI